MIISRIYSKHMPEFSNKHVINVQ